MALPQNTPDETPLPSVSEQEMLSEGASLLDTMKSMSAVSKSIDAKEAAAVPPPVEIPKPKSVVPGGEYPEMDMSPTPVPTGPIPGPWRNPSPPADTIGIMREMTKANPDRRSRKERYEAGRGPQGAGGMPEGDVDRMNFAGAELEHVMAQRTSGLLEGFGRLLKAQTDALRTATEMIADHERRLRDIQSYLERSRS